MASSKPPLAGNGASTNSQSPSKKVTLKLRVRDQDLAEGKYRKRSSRALPASRPSKNPNSKSKPKSKPKYKHTPVSRNLVRNRSRHTSAITTAAEITRPSDIYVSDEEEEQEDQRGLGGRGHDVEAPSFSKFRALSLLTFPVLLKDERAEGVGVGGRWQKQTQTQADVRSRAPARASMSVSHTGHSKRCAGCGVSAPLELARHHHHHHDHVISNPVLPPLRAHNAAPRSLADAADVEPSHLPASRPPWELLNLQPTRHINPETSSVTELVITRSGPVPNTAEFWYDMTMGEMAAGTEDVDFKMLCLNLMRWRAENDVGAAGLPRVICGQSTGVRGEGIRVSWDDVVGSAVATGKMWRKIRRQKESECGKAAGWAVWERKQRRGSRGEFVEDGNGAWVLRAPGEDGPVRRILRLGYRRCGRPGGLQRPQNGNIATTWRNDGDGALLPGRSCNGIAQSMCEEAVEEAPVEDEGDYVADTMNVDEVTGVDIMDAIMPST